MLHTTSIRQVQRAALLLLTVLLLFACKQPVKGKNGITYKTPADYNDYIISRQTRLIKNIITLGRVAGTHVDSAYGMLDTLAAEASRVIDEIKGMPPYREDSAFRDAAVRSFGFYKKLFNEGYKRILFIRQQGGDETEEGSREILDITDKIKREEETLDKQLHNAQTGFAEKYHMKMRPNTIQQEIDKQE
ncbi:MAG: hypothetical protein HYZ15_14885 [Sphingobacteriales bacterium]|nr:hypothetical protein [Sphingobacteriales bacterium]